MLLSEVICHKDFRGLMVDMDWLENKPFTTLFVDGNHENFDLLNAYPEQQWHVGRVHVVRPHVLHLMRGQVFDIGGLTWFTMGGAASHDIDDGILNPAEPDFEHKYWKMRRMVAYFRVLGHAWWTEEMPSEAEYAETEANLEQVGWSADCVLTHCASTGVAKAAGPGYQPDRLTDFLESVKERRQFSRWFCGHYRTNRVIGEQFNTLHAMVIIHDGSDAARSALDAAMAELFVDHLSTGDVALLPLFHLGRGGIALIRGRLRLGPLWFGLEVELGFRLKWLPPKSWPSIRNRALSLLRYSTAVRCLQFRAISSR